MANIRCKACGKQYDYHKSELCPDCGAYNRPSGRLRVDFDKEGNAELLTEKQFLQQSKADKQRERVCYEHKECHEEQTRIQSDSSRNAGLNTQQMTEKLKTFEKQTETLFRGKRDEKQTGSNFWYVAAVVVIFMLLRACARI